MPLINLYLQKRLFSKLEGNKIWVGRTKLQAEKRDGLNIHIPSTFALRTPRYYAPINSKVQHPPRATPRAFELLKIGLVKFPPLGAKKPFKCPTNYY